MLWLLVAVVIVKVDVVLVKLVVVIIMIMLIIIIIEIIMITMFSPHGGVISINTTLPDIPILTCIITLNITRFIQLGSS